MPILRKVQEKYRAQKEEGGKSAGRKVIEHSPMISGTRIFFSHISMYFTYVSHFFS